ncbi:MAG: glucose-6-phosphate isomerase [Candidatus Methylacidiphilales bacterium]
MNPSWQAYQNQIISIEPLGITLDVSRMQHDPSWIEDLKPRIDLAFDQMNELEKGSIANPDENRMVGHYWLRNPALAPDSGLRKAIESTLEDVNDFVRKIHAGSLCPPGGGKFTELLVVGIGGSALGPQFIADALGDSDDFLNIHFIDNTDPDGIARVLTRLGSLLASTLTVVISKSGGTKETRNGMLMVANAYHQQGLEHAPHFVAITGEGSLLDQTAVSEKWLKRFPMWDWVGGRTSVMSTVGLVPMALQGCDIESFLDGAAQMDAATRVPEALTNPAMMLALMWHHAGEGRGKKDMVVLPYKDRLMLFSKYLQQLVMESLGKEKDLDGRVVHQGIAVYGNKGSTDQHAYVQQLRDGVNNFFVTFIEVRCDGKEPQLEVEPGVTAGDYLQGFLRGTRAALTEGGRQNMTLSVPEVSARQVGALIALYERAVGFYASLVNVNAYHQPGVEAGKKAATRLLDLQQRIVATLNEKAGHGWTAEELAQPLEADPEDVYHILTHLAANRPDVTIQRGSTPAECRFVKAG